MRVHINFKKHKQSQVTRIKIIYNYLSEFERIRTGDYEKPLIRSGELYKWSLTITCMNSLKFEQIIIENYNTAHSNQNHANSPKKIIYISSRH